MTTGARADGAHFVRSCPSVGLAVANEHKGRVDLTAPQGGLQDCVFIGLAELARVTKIPTIRSVAVGGPPMTSALAPRFIPERNNAPHASAPVKEKTTVLLTIDLEF